MPPAPANHTAMRPAPLVTPARTPLTYLLHLLLVGLAVFAASQVSQVMPMLHGGRPPLWPLTGVAFAALLLCGARVWPAVLAVALWVNLHEENQGPALIIACSLANIVGVALPAYLIRRREGGPPTFETLRSVVGFAAYGVVLGPLVAAVITVIGVLVQPTPNHGYPLQVGISIFIAHANSALLIGALAAAWLGRRPGAPTRGRWWEAGGLVGAMGVAASLTHAITPLYLFIAFPVVTWTALRFGARGATLVALATWGLSAEAISHLLFLPRDGVISFSLFYGLLQASVSGTGLILAASAAERESARRREHVADDHYRALVSSAPLAMIGLDREARVNLWSPEAERLFGWTAAEVLGQPLPIVPPERADEFQGILDGRHQPLPGRETVRRRRDGSLVEVLIHTWPLRNADGGFDGSLAALQDITARASAERLQSALFRVAQAALVAADLDALYPALHGIVNGLMPAANFFIALYDASSDSLSFPYWVDQYDPPPSPRRARNGLTEYVIRTGRPLRDRPASIDALRHRGEVEAFGTESVDWIGVPLIVGGATIGVLAVQTYDPGVSYTERDQEILEFVSHQVAMVIERKRGEAALRATASELEAVLAAMPDVILVLDRQGTFLRVAPTRPDYLFRPAAEVVGRTLEQVLPPDVAPLARATIGAAFAEQRPVTVEYQQALQGVPHWFAGTASPMGADRLLWVARDITPVKESQLLEQAVGAVARAAVEGTTLREVFAQLHQAVAALMPARNCHVALVEDGQVTFPYWEDEREAPQVSRERGRSYTDWVLRHGRALRYRAGRAAGVPSAAEAAFVGAEPADWMGVPLAVGDVVTGVLSVQTWDAGYEYSEREQALLELVAGQVATAIERKRAEAAVRRSEERFRALAATSSDVVYDCDYLSGRDWWSDNVRDILGYPPEEMQPGDAFWAQLIHPDEREAIAGSYARALAEGADFWRGEYQVRRSDGSYAWVLDRTRIERDAEGRVVRVFGAMLDVTSLREAREALRRSEEQLRQAAKMEAVGRLAGGVAHDFNNLLTSVLGHADLALGLLPPDDPLQDDLQEIKAAGSRAAALTQQLLAFSRKQLLEPRVLDLNAVVSGIGRMLRRTIGEDVTLVTRLAPDLGRVRADPVQMEQVVLNLAVNARDAMPDGGRLTIETLNVRLPSGAGVRVVVEDTGVGMSEEVRHHVFEPFFTTKDVGKGTGLGLATAYGIVEQSGGSITVQSEVGQGSRFLIDLPQVGAEELPPAAQLTALSHHGQETILLVEDEEAVRNLTRRVLEQHGYTVLSAPEGETAMALARSHPGPIHLLFTDVVMPGMSGPRLAQLLVAERPEVRCLFMSGYAASALGPAALAQGESRFLQKPFTTTQMLQRLREALATSTHSP